MTKHNRFPPEVRQCSIRMVMENQNTYNSQWAAICAGLDDAIHIR
ncbi:hypothetical protein [Scandinavium goeteborgense]|nr:hypothetical protein [Scandinavium goeteborgense]